MDGRSREKRANVKPAMKRPATIKMDITVIMRVESPVNAWFTLLARYVLSRRRDFSRRYRSILRNVTHFRGVAVGVAEIAGGMSFVGIGVV